MVKLLDLINESQFLVIACLAKKRTILACFENLDYYSWGDLSDCRAFLPFEAPKFLPSL